MKKNFMLNSALRIQNQHPLIMQQSLPSLLNNEELAMQTFDRQLLPPDMLKAMTGSEEEYEDWRNNTSAKEIAASLDSLMSQIDPSPPTSDSPEPKQK